MSIARPIVVDLGRISSDKIDRLRQGDGQLLEDVEEVMRLVRLRADPDKSNRIFLPIIAVYRRARRDGNNTDDDAAADSSRAARADDI